MTTKRQAPANGYQPPISRPAIPHTDSTSEIRRHTSFMRSNQRHVLFISALVAAGALFGFFSAGAQQKPDQKAQQAQQKEDEPVAITERAKVEKKVEPVATTD